MILGACTHLSEWGALFARVAQLFKWRMLPACDTPAITVRQAGSIPHFEKVTRPAHFANSVFKASERTCPNRDSPKCLASD